MENLPQPRFVVPKPPKILAKNSGDGIPTVEPISKIDFGSAKPVVEKAVKPAKPVKEAKVAKEPRVKPVKEVKTVVQKPASLFDSKKLPKTNKTIIALTCSIVLLAGLSGFLGYDKLTTGSRIAGIQNTVDFQKSQIDDQASSLEAKEGNIQALTAENAQLKEDVATKDSLLDARVGFVEALKPVNEAIASADGKVDITANVTIINTAKDTVFAERKNVNKINAQKPVLVEQTKLITDAVVKWQAAEALKAAEAAKALKAAEEAKAKQAVGAGSTAKEALNSIAGDTVTMTLVDWPCDTKNDQVAACVISTDPTNIQVAKRFLDRDLPTWKNIMMHEYGHVVQFRDYPKFIASSGYTGIFKSDPEWYTDCMAMSKIGSTYSSGYKYACSPEQLAVASKAWSGDFS